ncbi:MAG: hypothetical protein BGP01_12990 [Paludibacter sp. 47-17]|nr:MAG: hypothetical protein BGP01_12990 [Paludibacter sp. 47-17]
MYKLIRYAVTSLLAAFISFNAWSVPAYPHAIQVVQPDGSTLTIRIYGDEHRKLRTTVDGYAIKINPKGFYVYTDTPTAPERIARDPGQRSSEEQSYLSRIGRAEPLQQPATKAFRMKKAPVASASTAFPTTGSPRSLVIMVNFSDKSFVTSNPQEAFTRLLNEQGYSANGATGSARDYFKAASNGAFSPQFDVVGPYTLPNNMAYYGANDEDDYDVKPTDMVIHACSLANNDVNFADYDADNDGYVDNIFIYYAGYNEAEGGPENSIWPHRWWVHSGNFSGSRVFDGKTIFDYACTSELGGSSGSNMCGIGTFTHEFGHVIGLPDHYHTEDPDKNTLNYWSIMDLGAYLNEGRTPPTYSAYDRFFLGWLTPQELTMPGRKTLLPLSQSMSALADKSGQAYLVSATPHNLNGANPAPKEFFVVEYRRKTGWDTYLPGEGMLIWHIDYDANSWDQNGPNNYTGTTQTADSHMRIYLQPLSGNSTTPGAAFTSGSFYPTTWNGVNINRPITNITKSAENIQFDIMGGIAQQVPVIVVGAVTNTLSFGVMNTGSVKSRYLNLTTSDVPGSLSIVLGGEHASQFEVSATSIPASGTEPSVAANLTVSYRPTATGKHTATLTIGGNGLTDRIIELKGEAK